MASIVCRQLFSFKSIEKWNKKWRKFQKQKYKYRSKSPCGIPSRFSMSIWHKWMHQCSEQLFDTWWEKKTVSISKKKKKWKKCYGQCRPTSIQNQLWRLVNQPNKTQTKLCWRVFVLKCCTTPGANKKRKNSKKKSIQNRTQRQSYRCDVISRNSFKRQTQNTVKHGRNECKAWFFGRLLLRARKKRKLTNFKHCFFLVLCMWKHYYLNVYFSEYLSFDVETANVDSILRQET